MKTFYVYVLARPSGTPFYVGKGKGRRVFDHDSEAARGHRCYKCNVIRKIWKQGGQVQRYIMLETDDETEAFSYEMELIALYGRDNLCNLTDGGEGVSGLRHSETTRAKLAELGRTPESLARLAEARQLAYTPEARARNAERGRRPESLARLAEARKRQADPAVRAKMSAAQKGKKLSPEQRARAIAILHSPETKAKKAAAMRRPETCAKMSVAHRGKTLPPEQRAKIAAAARDPEMRARNAEAHRTPENIARLTYHARNRSPETRAKLAAAARNISPETRAKMSAAAKARANSPEGRAHLKAARQKQTITSETRAKISASMKAHRAQMREQKIMSLGEDHEE